MANNAPLYGFRPAGYIGGGAVPKPIRGRIASGYAGATGGGGTGIDLRPGDPINRVNDGTFKLAAAGQLIAGVIAGILPFNRTRDGATYKDFGFQLPSGTTWTAEDDSFLIMYYPAAGMLFEVDVDENTTATTQATYATYIDENCDHAFTRDATHLWAGPRLDISTHATADGQWRIVDLSRRRNLDYSGTGVKLIVQANELSQAPYGTAAAGV